MLGLSSFCIQAQNACIDWSSNSTAPVSISTSSFQILIDPPSTGAPGVFVIVQELPSGNIVYNDLHIGSSLEAVIYGLQPCTDYEYYVVNCDASPSDLSQFTPLSVTTLCFDCNGVSECQPAEPIIDVDNTTSAEIFWPVVDCADEYLLYYRCTSTPGLDQGWLVINSLTTPYYYLSGLDPCCHLEVKVITKCVSNGITDYSESEVVTVQMPGAEVIDFEDFNDWGIYNDMGTDCWRINNGNVSASAPWCLALRDNTSTSRTITDVLPICGSDEIRINLKVRFDNMTENKGVKIHFWNGSSWNLLEYIRMDNDEHFDNIYYDKTYTLDALTYAGETTFGPSCKIQIRNFGNANANKTYIDDVLISSCSPINSDCNNCTNWNVNSGPATTINSTGFYVPFTPPSDNSDLYFIVREATTGAIVIDCYNPANDEEGVYAYNLTTCTDYEYLLLNCDSCPTNLDSYDWTPVTTACYNCNGATECAEAQPIIDIDNTTGAEVFWPVVDCADEYILYWKCTATPGIDAGWNLVNLTTPYHYLAGLDPCCHLEVKVVTKCVSDGVSDYSDYSDIVTDQLRGTMVDFEDFDDWGIYNDAGTDSYRLTNNATLCYSGIKCLALRDNTISSRSWTDELDICGVDKIRFNFVMRFEGMEDNKGLVVDFHDGNSWLNAEYYRIGADYQNGVFYIETLTIDAPTYGGSSVFGPNCQLRFRTTGDDNTNKAFIDNALISACSPATCRIGSEALVTNEPLEKELKFSSVAIDNSIKVYPNPAVDILSIETPVDEEVESISVYTINGSLLKSFTENKKLGNYDVSDLTDGIYLIQVKTAKTVYTEKFIVKH